MKNPITTALGGALVATAAIFTLPTLLPERAEAALVATGEVYAIFSLAPFDSDLPRMEQELNALAAQGWTVRTGVGGALVLARPR